MNNKEKFLEMMDWEASDPYYNAEQTSSTTADMNRQLNRKKEVKPTNETSVIKIDDDDDGYEIRDTPSNPIVQDRILINSNRPILEASGYQAEKNAGLDADAAFALELQRQEYSRDTILPFHNPYFLLEDSEIPQAGVVVGNVTDSNNRARMSDAELAADLQEQENRRRRGHLGFLRRASRQNPMLGQNRAAYDAPPVRIVDDPSPERFFDDRHSEQLDVQDLLPQSLFGILANGEPVRMRGSPGFNFFGRGLRRRHGHGLEAEDDFGPEDYERLLQLDDRIRKKTLGAQQINQIPTEKYKKTDDGAEEVNKCSICLEEYNEDDNLRRFPCKHRFHITCADHWLHENNICPICREIPVKSSSRTRSNPRRGGDMASRSDRTNNSRSMFNNRSSNARDHRNQRGSRNFHP